MMKKTLFSLTATTIAIFAAIILFTTCKREYYSCTPREPDIKEVVAFNLINNSLHTECIFYKATGDNYYREIGMLSTADEKLFQFLKSYCMNNNISVDDQSMTFIFYLDYPICQSYTITDEHIKGISVYNVEGNRIMHHLFVRNENSDFTEVENVKVAVSYVSTNHAHFYLENYVFSDPQNKAFITAYGDLFVKINKDLHKYKTGFRFELRERRFGKTSEQLKT